MKKIFMLVCLQLCLATAFSQTELLINAGVGFNTNFLPCVTADAGVVLFDQVTIAATGTLNTEALKNHTEAVYVGYRIYGYRASRAWEFMLGLGSTPLPQDEKANQPARQILPMIGVSRHIHQIEISARYTFWNGTVSLKYNFAGRREYYAPLKF